MNVDKNFVCVQQFEHIAAALLPPFEANKQATRAPTKHKTIWMNMPGTSENFVLATTGDWWWRDSRSSRSSSSRSSNNDDDNNDDYWLLRWLTERHTHKLHNIYLCLSPMIVLEPLKTKVLPKTNKLLKIFPKDLCELCWKVKKTRLMARAACNDISNYCGAFVFQLPVQIKPKDCWKLYTYLLAATSSKAMQ